METDVCSREDQLEPAQVKEFVFAAQLRQKKQIRFLMNLQLLQKTPIGSQCHVSNERRR
jgi:hypothetical protein